MESTQTQKQFVPIFEQLEQLYANGKDEVKNKHETRFKNLKTRFK